MFADDNYVVEKKLVLCSNEVFNLSDTEREESGKIMISLSDF